MSSSSAVATAFDPAPARTLEGNLRASEGNLRADANCGLH